MTVTLSEIRPGAYFDSVILMQLQRSLAELDGILDAGVVMATPANLDLLAASDLLIKSDAGPDDLLIVVKGENEQFGSDALSMVDNLLAERRQSTGTSFYPRSLAAAAKQLASASLVSISVPGRFAAGVAREVLDLGKHVFIYSDNVSLEDELSLKRRALDRGLLVMGPDCGTAIIGGIGLGFANRVRRGSIGLVGASGTGLQFLTSQIHQRGSGVSQAIGTGGRDLKKEINAITTLQSLALLERDQETAVIILVSKPPEPEVAARVLEFAQLIAKPIVVNFIGLPIGMKRYDNLHFASNMVEAGALAVNLDKTQKSDNPTPIQNSYTGSGKSGHLRALFSGGTLAYEMILSIQSLLSPLYTNIPIRESQRLTDVNRSQGHTILDMGEDEFTQGRLHPMMDNDLRIRRMLKEAGDPEVAIILFDVVLGEGAHPDPASELAGGVRRARDIAEKMGNSIAFKALLVGTDEDPQDIELQESTLRSAGVEVFHETSELVAGSLALLNQGKLKSEMPVDSTIFNEPMAVINVGLELFYSSLISQGAEAVHVDWRPPAGGNENLMALLARMKSA
ncbi:MAG: acyl-CoA synthetase FdrA [Anaerolineae bacterium]|nr:MAG: acyl-CoA synthetase FdrA [Anaerolineae bacterium]